MATSSYKTFLMKGTTSGSSTTYSKLVDIKDFPDLGGTPEMLDTTTLSDKMKTSIAGIQSIDSLQFTLNYDSDTYDTLDALTGVETKYAVWFGGTESSGVVTPTGSEGKFEFTGTSSVYATGKGVNEVREMVFTIAPSTPIIKAD